jgi:hypothetical protein
MSRKVNTVNRGRAKNYINGTIPLTKIGSRDLSKLKFNRTVKCAGGSASKEEVEKLNKEVDDLKEVKDLLISELTNERTTGLSFIPAKDDPNIGFVNPRGSEEGRFGFGDGSTLYDSYADVAARASGAWSDLNKTLREMTKVNNGNSLLEAGANTITVVPGKRIDFVSGDMVGNFLGAALTANTVYQLAGDPNIEEVFFMHTNDTTHRFVSFNFNQQTGAITKFDAGYDEGRAAYIGMTDGRKELQIDTFKVSGAVKRQNPAYPITLDGVPWVISNISYQYNDP